MTETVEEIIRRLNTEILNEGGVITGVLIVAEYDEAEPGGPYLAHYADTDMPLWRAIGMLDFLKARLIARVKYVNAKDEEGREDA